MHKKSDNKKEQKEETATEEKEISAIDSQPSTSGIKRKALCQSSESRHSLSRGVMKPESASTPTERDEGAERQKPILKFRSVSKELSESEEGRIITTSKLVPFPDPKDNEENDDSSLVRSSGNRKRRRIFR